MMYNDLLVGTRFEIVAQVLCDESALPAIDRARANVVIAEFCRGDSV